MASEKSDRVNLKAAPEWVARASGAAGRLGLSLSAFIRLAVNEKIRRDGLQAEPPQGETSHGQGGGPAVQ